MTDDGPPSRRDSLRILAAAGAFFGAGTAGVSAVASDGGRDVDPDAIDLVFECAVSAVDVAIFRVDNDTDRPIDLEWTVRKRPPEEPVVAFPDCETVVIRGDVADVILYAEFIAEDGGVGTFVRPVGPVEDRRTITAEAEFGEFPAGPIITAVELFEETPVAPGGGDVRDHPDVEGCRRRVLGTSGDGDPDGSDDDWTPEDYTPPTDGAITVPAGGSEYVLAHAPDGEATMRLVDADEEIARAESDPEELCDPHTVLEAIDLEKIEKRDLDLDVDDVDHRKLDPDDVDREELLERALEKKTGDDDCGGG